MMFNYWLFLIPLITALTGWLCIRLPFLILFRPARPLRILGFRIQGIIPANQEVIARQAGLFAAARMPFDALEAKINDPENFERVKPVIEVHIDDFLRNKLKEQMPMIAMFIGDKTITQLKTVFIQEIANLFPQVIGQFAGNLKTEFDVGALVARAIRDVDLTDLEQRLKEQAQRPLYLASMAGLLIGLVAGIVQMIIIWLAGTQSIP